MFKSLVFSLGLVMVLVGGFSLLNEAPNQSIGQVGFPAFDAPGPITWDTWAYCNNGGATCTFCFPHGGCTINGAGTACVIQAPGTAGCAAGPSRSRGSCAFSAVSDCPYRANLCGSSVVPICFNKPLWYIDEQGSEAWDCGTGACTPVGGAGDCDGC